MMNSKLLYFFFLFFIHLCSVYSFNGTHKCSNEQMDALLLFKQNISYSDDVYSYPHYYYCDSLLGSGYHPITMNWNKSIDCYHWNGVTRNHLGDVIGLDLRCGMLKGFLRALKNLEFLDLAGNNIHGLIPDWAGEMGGNKLVYLDLSDNYITGLSLFQWSGLEHLYLQSNMIRGQFPLSICDMNNLKFLDISDNIFGGMVPQCLGNSRFLVSLNVNSNMIRGPFPTTVCNMNNLKYLDISNNRFGGMVPPCLGNSSFLVSLNVNSNMIRGPFPTTVCNNMTHLKYLDMSNNSFYGVIPQCFENITSSLLMINLGLNNFTGTIPNVTENCTLSEGLLLNNNQLEGDVPRSLLKCQDLKVLDLGNNHLKGIFPRWLEEVTKLEVLILRSNNLHGVIETSSTMGFPFSRVKIFDISNNGFVGPLPEEYFKNFDAIKDAEKIPNVNITNTTGSYYSIIVPVKNPQYLSDWLGSQLLVKFSVIDLSSNKFEGEIPNVIGSLNSLILLNLSHNNLSGQIPHELGNLLQMESLDLSWNQLSGEIPQSLSNLTFLGFLNLSQNHLEGHIPQGGQFQTFSDSPYGGNLGLCGYPLSKQCDDRDMIPAQVDNDHGDGNMFPWEVVVLGYGCGILLGFMMGYRMLSTGKPKWFNEIYDALERMIPIRRKKKKRVNTKKRNQRSNGRKF